MKTVDVTAGSIEYREEGDPNGPPVVLMHGLLMNDSQWDLALPTLPSGFRYLLPVLGRMPIDAITPSVVRTWWSRLPADKPTVRARRLAPSLSGM